MFKYSSSGSSFHTFFFNIFPECNTITLGQFIISFHYVKYVTCFSQKNTIFPQKSAKKCCFQEK